MTVHWGFGGDADGFASKAVAVFVLPLILLLIFWLCIFVTAKDKKQQEQSPKALNVVFFIIPVLSLVINAMIYAIALEIDFSPLLFLYLLLGISFIIIGNILPKCRQNLTLGIKIKWTLLNEENWNATHRFSGKVWCIGGIVFFLCAFLPENAGLFVIFPLIFILVAASSLYSYIYYKKQVKEGRWEETFIKDNDFYKKGVKYTLLLVPVIIVLCLILSFTGKIETLVNDDGFDIKATYMRDINVSFDEIDFLEYREDFDVGVRTAGFGSPVLSMGTFKNKEFGYYTLYAYTKSDGYVIIKSGEKVIVIADKNPREFYEKIKNSDF
jgi:uncharacterized membrane protein